MTRPQTDWRPGLGTHSALLVALLSAAFVFSPTFWTEFGADAKDLYAAGALSAVGGNPYLPSEQFAAEERIFDDGGRLRPGMTGYYAPQAYAYPPVLTRVLEVGARLAILPFELVLFGLFIAAGLAGFELAMILAEVRRRWEWRLFFLASSPMVLALFVGNPSTLLLLAWAAGALLLSRNRPVAAGLVLTLTLLKPPVGLPVALAALVFAPVAQPAVATRLRATAAFVVGSAGWALVNVAVARPGALVAWLRALNLFQGELANPASAGIRQSGMAGLPALLLGSMPTGGALALTLPLVAVVLWAGLRRLQKARSGAPAYVPLALGTAAALVASPYLHVNDLVLESLPVLALFTVPLGLARRATLLLVALFLPLSLAFNAATALTIGHVRPGQAGLGVLLSASVLVCLAATSG